MSLNDVDMARAIRLMTEDAEEIRKELVGGTARGLTPGLRQAIWNLLQSQAAVRTTWEAIVAVEKPAPPTSPAAQRPPPLPAPAPARQFAKPAPPPAHVRPRERPSPEAVARRLGLAPPEAVADMAQAERATAPRKKGGITEAGRRALAAKMAARWKDPAFRAKHAAAMAKKANRRLTEAR